ncbi:hypothetical protein Trydic_g15256 [Trypoxylus dichotomus]
MAKTNVDGNRRMIRKCYLSKRKYRNLQNYFEECTSYSSLHGVKYLGERNRTLIEKIGWFIIIAISIIICAYFVHETYKKWETTPILVTVGTTQLPIQHVTFPAVTICPAMKVAQNLVDILNKFNVSSTENLTDKDKLSFKHAQMWCQYSNYFKFIQTFGFEERYNLDALEFIYNNTPPMQEIFWTCQWSGDDKNCSDIFTPTFTEEGVCYTFNSINRSNLFELGVLPFKDFNNAKATSCYDDYKSTCRDSYPYRTTPGVEAGLQVFLTVPKDNLNPCIDIWKGHKVLIHQPNELPSTKNNYFYIPLTESVTVALIPQVIVTDESLRSYTVEQRKCYYDDEKNLTHFKYYTQTNCEAECYLYATKLYWNCSDFYMPHISDATNICNGTISYTLRRSGHHIKNHLANTSMNIPDAIQNELDTVDVPSEAREVCNCLPSFPHRLSYKMNPASARKRRGRKTLTHVAKYFEECTGATSIHGVQYIGDRQRSCVERLIWAVIVATSVSICTKYVLQTYRKWESSPVYVTIGSGLVPIRDISFPAVTICPEVKSDADIYYYADWIQKAFDNETYLNKTERLHFEYMSVICNRTHAKSDGFNHQSFGPEIYDFLYSILPNFNDTFIDCKFSDGPKSCEEIFTPIFTKDGICYTFNTLDRAELFSKDVQHYQNFYNAFKSRCFNQKFEPDCEISYPRRASSSGVDAGLVVELRARAKDMDFKCASPLQGYKVIVHNPSEVPTQNHNYLRLPLDQAVFVSLSPEVITTRQVLETYAASERQCYFNNEKKLSRFNHYTRYNCEVECLSYLIERILECLDFYLPRKNESIPICGANMSLPIKIIEKILVTYISNTTFLNLQLGDLVIKALIEELKLVEQTSNYCDCLPSCRAIDYSFETTQTDYYWYRFADQDRSGVQEYRSLLNIHFKDAYYIPLQREEMFGAMDFIAYSGGLMGLFIGFSFISSVEIVYFLTLRIACNILMFGRKLWYGNPQ